MGDDVPLLRADATDDDLYEPKTTLTGTEWAKAANPALGSRVKAEVIPDSEEPEPAEPVIVEKHQVPVMIEGVLHGYAEEG